MEYDPTGQGGQGQSSGSQRVAKVFGGLARGAEKAQDRSVTAMRDNQKQLSRDSERFSDNSSGRLGSFKKGGKVKRTGLYQLHRGEVVTPAKRKRAKSRRA